MEDFLLFHLEHEKFNDKWDTRINDDFDFLYEDLGNIQDIYCVHKKEVIKDELIYPDILDK